MKTLHHLGHLYSGPGQWISFCGVVWTYLDGICNANSDTVTNHMWLADGALAALDSARCHTHLGYRICKKCFELNFHERHCRKVYT